MKTTKIQLSETNYLSVAKRVQELHNSSNAYIKKETKKIQFEKEKDNFKTKFYILINDNINLEFLFSLGYYTGLKA